MYTAHAVMVPPYDDGITHDSWRYGTVTVHVPVDSSTPPTVNVTLDGATVVKLFPFRVTDPPPAVATGPPDTEVRLGSRYEIVTPAVPVAVCEATANDACKLVPTPEAPLHCTTVCAVVTEQPDAVNVPYVSERRFDGTDKGPKKSPVTTSTPTPSVDKLLAPPRIVMDVTDGTW